MNPKTLNVALYLRLSRDTDSSASIETQRAAALAWLAANGITDYVLTEYVDAGVSGAKPLEARKGMAQLMADVQERVTAAGRNTPDETILIAWKLDRYARSVSEFLRLVAWGQPRNVRMATTDNTINTTTPTGRMVATVLAALAEWERDLIKSRITEGQATRRAQGRWGAGNPPYGYRIVFRDSAGNPVEKDNGSAYLEIHEEQAAVIRKAVDELLTNEDSSIASTARMVDVSEAQWRRMLKAPTLKGQRTHKGELVVAEDGITPVQFAEPIIGAAEFKKIQARVAKLSTGEQQTPRAGANLCAGMSWCAVCNGRLNGGRSDRGDQLYRCKAGHMSIYARVLDAKVETEFMTRFGGMAEYVVRLEGGNDLSDQLAEAEEQAKRLSKRMATAGPLMFGSLEELSAELEATYAALRAAHDPDVREVLEPTGRTLGEAWEASPGSRGRLLRDLGLHVVLTTNGRGRISAERVGERVSVSWAIGGDDQELAEMIGDMEAAR
jgi:DNA invertase Pin-like site-specific DNA recombinase